jgi:hypothetical protein
MFSEISNYISRHKRVKKPAKPVVEKKITIGVCAMDKKAKSKPMREILNRLTSDLFTIVIFGNECILHKPIEDWPVIDCLITFYSTNFPTAKVMEYIRLRKPFLINDLAMNDTLIDRQKIYNLLEEVGIDTPKHVFADRSGGKTVEVEEFDDYIVVNGKKVSKPFVEKPFNAEDHNIYIYCMFACILLLLLYCRDILSPQFASLSFLLRVLCRSWQCWRWKQASLSQDR